MVSRLYVSIFPNFRMSEYLKMWSHGRVSVCLKVTVHPLFNLHTSIHLQWERKSDISNLNGLSEKYIMHQIYDIWPKKYPTAQKYPCSPSMYELCLGLRFCHRSYCSHSHSSMVILVIAEIKSDLTHSFNQWQYHLLSCPGQLIMAYLQKPLCPPCCWQSFQPRFW